MENDLQYPKRQVPLLGYLRRNWTARQIGPHQEFPC